MSKYPYIQGKKKVSNVVCDTCKSKVVVGLRLEWRVDIFQGNCEFENTCHRCYKENNKKREEEARKYAEKKREREEAWRKKEEKFWAGMKARVEEKYEVKYLSPYQWRINGALDLYIQSRRYHDIKNNKRGDYRDMHKFLKKFFNSR